MTEIRLYNTLTREKEKLREPSEDDPIGLYVCGPTVYDRAHIGNARPVIVFDVLARLLRQVHGAEKVRYVRNITDVDDKINRRALETRREGETLNDAARRITTETADWFHEDMAAVGAEPPDEEPRATDHIAEMITIIERLIARRHAYAAQGHVLFSVKTDPAYGELARRSLDDMLAGARVDVAPYKRDPMDFVLWKPSSEDEPGWDSPWGRGRPGWHIECSAMSEKHLGQTFDIHGGGVDLVFPHHENERAQSLCAHPDSEFARIWMHNGFVQVEGEKMSKSLGNFITVRDLRETVPGEVIRLAMLTTHYRQPFDWSEAMSSEAEAVLRKWRKLAANAEPGGAPSEIVIAALSDDLNTPKALVELHRLANAGDAAGLRATAGLLGLLTPELGLWAEAPMVDADLGAQIEALLAARKAARAAKDFAKSDALRDGLTAAGVEVRDTPRGVEWSLSPSFDAAKLPEGV